MHLLPGLILIAAASAQTEPTFRADSRLALVRFQVNMNPKEAVAGVRAADIRILEDGRPQKISHFEGSRGRSPGLPMQVVLLFDCSRSVQMNRYLHPQVFEERVLGDYGNLSIGVYAFSEGLTRIAAPGRDAAAIRRALKQVAAQEAGDTALFRSIAGTLLDVQWNRPDAPGVEPGTLRMLAVISDGESTMAGDSLLDRQAMLAARELGVAIYPVLLTVPNTVAAMREQIASVRSFLDLARATGGEAIAATNELDLLPRILKTIATREQFEYVAGYYPQAMDGAHHQVQVVWNDRSRGAILGGTRVVVH